MPGYQFIHVQTYSRKISKAGNTVDQVVDEAIRDLAFCLHVANPVPPRVIIGDPSTFKELHNAHVVDRATKVMVKDAVRYRAIRNDRHTLATIISSYPLQLEEIKANGAEALANHKAWELATIAFVQKMYGEQLRVVLAHEDEAYPHLHFWMLPDNSDADAKMLHPGKAKKAQVEAKSKSKGDPPKLAVKLGNAACREEMRRFQDSYYHEVTQPLGMLRDGPKRRRETRKEWNRRKEEALRVAVSIQRAQDADKTSDDAKKRILEANNEAAQILESARTKEDEINIDRILTDRNLKYSKIAKDEALSDIKKSEAMLETAGTEIRIMMDEAQSDADAKTTQAKSDAEKIRAEAHDAGFNAGHASGWARANSEISDLRAQAEAVFEQFSGWSGTARKIVKYANIDIRIIKIAKTILEEGCSLASSLDRLRKTLHRSKNNNYSDSIMGQTMRDTDARELAPFYAEKARREATKAVFEEEHTTLPTESDKQDLEPDEPAPEC